MVTVTSQMPKSGQPECYSRGASCLLALGSWGHKRSIQHPFSVHATVHLVGREGLFRCRLALPSLWKRSCGTPSPKSGPLVTPHIRQILKKKSFPFFFSGKSWRKEDWGWPLGRSSNLISISLIAILRVMLCERQWLCDAFVRLSSLLYSLNKREMRTASPLISLTHSPITPTLTQNGITILLT